MSTSIGTAAIEAMAVLMEKESIHAQDRIVVIENPYPEELDIPMLKLAESPNLIYGLRKGHGKGPGKGRNKGMKLGSYKYKSR